MGHGQFFDSRYPKIPGVKGIFDNRPTEKLGCAGQSRDQSTTEEKSPQVTPLVVKALEVRWEELDELLSKPYFFDHQIGCLIAYKEKYHNDYWAHFG